MAEEDKFELIETVDEEGNPITFQLFDVIEFEGKDYALLLPYDEENEDEEAEMILMRLETEGDEYTFETIEDEDEFNAVAEYIESFGDDED